MPLSVLEREGGTAEFIRIYSELIALKESTLWRFYTTPPEIGALGGCWRWEAS